MNSARRERARMGGGQRRIDAQHGKGKLTARERITLLLDEGSFEDGICSSNTAVMISAWKITPSPVMVSYWLWQINGRAVFVFSQDFTVLGGSLSKPMLRKSAKSWIRP